MGIGQRKRQKLKRQRSRARLGDAAGNPRGAGDALRERWSDPSRGDLRRLAAAIRAGRLDEADDDKRQAIVDITGAVVHSPKSDRHALAACRVLIAADLKNLEAEETALHARKMACPPDSPQLQRVS